MASMKLDVAFSLEDLEKISNVELHLIAANVTICVVYNSQANLDNCSSTSNRSKLLSTPDKSCGEFVRNIELKSKEYHRKIFCYLLDKIEIIEKIHDNQIELNNKLKFRNDIYTYT